MKTKTGKNKNVPPLLDSVLLKLLNGGEVARVKLEVPGLDPPVWTVGYAKSVDDRIIIYTDSSETKIMAEMYIDDEIVLS